MAAHRTAKRLRSMLCLAAALSSWACLAQAPQGSGQNAAPAPMTRDAPSQASKQQSQSFEVLTDTQGVDFNPYLHAILRGIYDRWLYLLPPEVHPPEKLAGKASIRFRIGRDGTILAMHLDDSTRDTRLDRAAWGSISGAGQFPPLPEASHGPNLELRVHFMVNEEQSSTHPQDNATP